MGRVVGVCRKRRNELCLTAQEEASARKRRKPASQDAAAGEELLVAPTEALDAVHGTRIAEKDSPAELSSAAVKVEEGVEASVLSGAAEAVRCVQQTHYFGS